MRTSDRTLSKFVRSRGKDIEEAQAQIGESLDINFMVRGAWRDKVGNYRRFHGVDSIKKIVGANLSRSGREEKKK